MMRFRIRSTMKGDSEMVVIREAHGGDEGVITALIRELAAVNGEETPITEAYVKEYLKNSATVVLLAAVENKVVGLLSYLVSPNLFHAASSALIDELVVREEYRGQGVGSALMQSAMQRLQKASCAEVSVTTMFENKAAQAFYLKQGFTDQALFLERHF